jgi:hypothetical protein
VRRTRLRRLLASGLAAVLGSAACGGTPPAEPADPPATGAPPAVELTATLTVDGQRLHITYQLANRSDEPLIVLNRVPAGDANAVYVTGRGGSGRVEVAKRAFAMPETKGRTWAHPEQVSGVTLPSGQSVSEDLTVPLPLRRHHPYGDDLGYGTIKLPDPVKDVVFCVGVIREREAPPHESAGGTVTIAHLSGATRVQYLSCSAPLKL